MDKMTDWKNMDVAQFLQQFKGQKVFLAQAVLAAVALFILVGMLGQYMKDRQGLEAQMNVMRNKGLVIDSWKMSQQAQDKYQASLPKEMDADSLVAYLSDLADGLGVGIDSFAPGRQVEDVFFSTHSVDLVCKVDQFKSLVLLLQAIEKDPHALRVQSVKITRRADAGLDARLQVALIKIKNK